MKVGLTKWFFMSVLAFAGTGLPVSALAVASPALSANVIGRDINYSFKQLGANQSFDLRGLSNEASVSLGIRLDETVRSARLRLKVNYSPALIAQLSHIKIYLNNEVAGFVPVPEHAGNEPYVYELALDPRLFSDYNQLRMQLIGHFTRDCEDPAHTSIWASISNQSELLLRVEPLALQNDLALLPAPFFDRHDSRRLVLPVVFANSRYCVIVVWREGELPWCTLSGAAWALASEQCDYLVAQWRAYSRPYGQAGIRPAHLSDLAQAAAGNQVSGYPRSRWA